MTREEAIEILSRPKSMKGVPAEILTAHTMAIEALQTEPCEDCVSRQAAIDTLIGWETEPLDEDIERELRKLPSVKPEPKKGKWIKKMVRGSEELYCSNCGDAIDVIYEYNYCPNCGAKMQEVEE